MRYKKFTSASEVVHKKFVCDEFGLDFHDYGIDFQLGSTGIEMKGKKRYRKTITFCCSAVQVEEWEARYKPENLLWMFLLYDMSCKVSSVRSVASIPRHILNREFWLLPWDFVKQFRIHESQAWGPYYYLTTKNFPPDLKTETINGVPYHYANDPKIDELFERRLFLKT